MKKKQITGNMAKVFATCLFACILSAGLVGCSDKDIDSPDGPGGGGIPGQLVGTWYGDYSSRGEITTSAPGIRTGYYVRAVEGLTFNADGTGTCYQYLCNVAGDPISIYGGSMDAKNGQFHYTVKDDSIVTITRDGDGDATHPKTWQVINGWNGIRGNDGAAEYSMQTATAEEQGYLTNWEKLLRTGGNDDPEEMADFLNKESGVLGITGISSDMRDVEEAASKGNERAQLALRMYNYRIKKYIGAYAAAMGGVDVIVWTAGVGENQISTRMGACSGLEFLGIKMDEEANNSRGEEKLISAPDSKVQVWVVPTDEEIVIARDTMELTKK